MNELFLRLDIASWKPLLTACLLPPVPFIVALLLASISTRRRTGSHRLFVALVATLIWLSCCDGTADLLAATLLRNYPPLTPARISALRAQAKDSVAIIVLGSGLEDLAPEYNDSSLTFRSLERLRYGIWLSRQTGWPVGFSGGVGWGQLGAAPAAEARVAQRIATGEFNHPLRWEESQSRDTRENAVNTLAILKPHGIKHILLVTHFWHMPRSVKNFEAAAKGEMVLTPAPLGLARDMSQPLRRWLPSGDGLIHTREIVREWLGGLAGA